MKRIQKLAVLCGAIGVWGVGGLIGCGASGDGNEPESPADALILYQEDFNEPVADWIFDDPVNYVGWHIVADDGTDANEFTDCLSYNDGDSYNSEPWPNDGEAVSPEVDLQGRNAVVEFWCKYETEPDASDPLAARFGKDKRTVIIWLIPSKMEKEVVALVSSDKITADSSRGWTVEIDLSGTCGSPLRWHPHSIPVRLDAVMIRVGFRFESGDEFYNDFAGWGIDDFVVKEVFD